MRRFSKKVPLTLLAFMLAFAVMAAVVAAWPQYQGNGYHNGQITGTAPPMSSPSRDSKDLGGAIYTESLMRQETIDDSSYTFAYTLASNGTLYKTNCDQPGTLANPGPGEWAYSFGSGGFQLGSPCMIDDGNAAYDGIYAAVSDYAPLLLKNTQFTGAPLGTGWTPGGTGTVTYPTVSPDPSTPTVPGSSTTVCQLSPGASISQSFTFTGTTGSYETQWYSLIRQLSPGTANQQITFTVTGVGIADTVTAHQDGSWTDIQRQHNVTLTQNTTYTVTAQASASNSANVQLNHLEFNWRTAGVYKVPFSGGSSTLIAAIRNGQASTPVSVYKVNGTYYLYYGLYTASGNNYFQVNLNTSAVTAYASGNRHYWAGATLVDIPDEGQYVVFGSDNGYIYVRPVNNFGSATAGNIIDLSRYTSIATPAIPDPGNVRCTISQDGANIYFTSQGRYLWRIPISTLLTQQPATPTTPPGGPDAVYVRLPFGSTSTPAISQNGYVYVGHYGGPGGSGGVVAVQQGFANGASYTVIYNSGAVQASPIVYSTSAGTTLEDYVYFTTNVAAGKGYCYRLRKTSGGAISVSRIWTAGGTATPSNNYALQGFSAENGYLVYGSDSGTLYIMK